jgi:phospholipid/cholesterol/gamma-HCH transport system substrate-binding protein
LKVSNEIKIGLLVIIALAVLAFGYNFLQGSNIFNKENIYHAVYNNVDGLQTGNPVVINGFPLILINLN